MRAGKYNVAASSHPAPNTVTTEATYFSGMPCWTPAQAMVRRPTGLAWSFLWAVAQLKMSMDHSQNTNKDAGACRECPTTARNKGFKKKGKKKGGRAVESVGNNACLCNFIPLAQVYSANIWFLRLCLQLRFLFYPCNGKHKRGLRTRGPSTPRKVTVLVPNTTEMGLSSHCCINCCTNAEISILKSSTSVLPSSQRTHYQSV